MKGECTGSKSGRHIFRSFFQKYLDKAEAYRQTEVYQKAMRKRSVWVEPLFGEAKEFHRLRRFRLRRLLKVNIEGVMVAAGQNLIRLIKHNLSMLISFLESTFSMLIQSPNPHFFNRLAPCARNWANRSGGEVRVAMTKRIFWGRLLSKHMCASWTS